MNIITWNQLEKSQTEGLCDKYQFYICNDKEPGESLYIVDVFDANVENNAHIGGDTFDTFEEAKTWCEEYK